MKGNKSGNARVKKTTKSEVFWRVFPFALGLFILIYLILLSNGYEMFESRGWNVDTIVLLRKIEHLVLALGCLAGCIFLGRFYLLRVRAWKRGEQVSGFSLEIESVLLTLFILGPALVLLYFSIKIGITIIIADPSYWEGYWELK